MTEIDNKNIILTDISYFNLYETLNCGQFFRFEKTGEGTFKIIAGDRLLKVSDEKGKIILHNTSEDEFKNFWSEFFDIGTDYNEIMEYLFKKDSEFKKIAEHSKGIRILKQKPWETLCSFIISQNNNIPRIKGIIQRLCENFGEKIEDKKENIVYYSFPRAEVLAKKTPDDLSVIRSGFRAKYITDAAQKVASKEVNLELVKEMPLEQASEYLMKIKGVGIKVAMCSLLYGFNKLDAFPQDVWIKRAMKMLYNGRDFHMFGKYAGVAQQYIFNYIRDIEKA